MTKKTIFLLDPGHGGIAAGHYLTPGKRSPEVPPGIYEGEFNREVCNWIVRLNAKYHNVINTNLGPINIPLTSRVSFVNQFCKREKNCALISLHANAAKKKGWSKGSGFVIFHSRKASKKSKRLARIMLEEFKSLNYFSSRGIKQANHTVTTKTNCPAILIECGFMTNKHDAELLADPITRHRIARVIAQGMDQYVEAQN